jgi:hypothetical protein
VAITEFDSHWVTLRAVHETRALQRMVLALLRRPRSGSLLAVSEDGDDRSDCLTHDVTGAQER